MMNNEKKTGFEVLEELTQWPIWYLFKFVLPTQEIEKAKSYLADEKTFISVRHVQVRESKQGRFVSYTFESYSQTSHDVKKVYEKFRQIEGIISL